MKNLLYIALALTAWSCSPTYQACKNKFGGDSLVTFKDSTVYRIIDLEIKADTMSGEVSLEDLLTNDYEKETPKQKTNIEINKGNLKYRNICKGDTIHHTDTFNIRTTITITKHFKDQSVAKKLISNFKWWWLVLLAVMIASVGYFIQAVKK